MKKKLNIFSQMKISEFIKQVLSGYELNFIEIDNNSDFYNIKEPSVIFLENEKDYKKITTKKLNNNFIVINNFKLQEKTYNNDKLLLKPPFSIHYFNNKVKKILQNNKTKFESIEIIDKKMINSLNNKTCYLTEIEEDILTYLINTKEGSKEFIRSNILNLKSNIETNSIDSHLTRIRKKLDKLETNIKIKTKNDHLLIFVS